MDLKKDKGALPVVLALEEQGEFVMEIPEDKFNAKTGMDTLHAKLDSLFLKVEKDRTYKASSSFNRITRDCSVSMSEHIINFEQRYSQMH